MSQNWLHISPTSGNGNTQMTITADSNKTGFSRKAKIIVTAGTMTRTIDVLQNPSEADIVITYVVDSSTVKLLSSISTYPCQNQFVLSTATSAITGINPTQATDYSQSLGLQSGDTLTLSIYTNCLTSGYTTLRMTEPEIPVTSIAFYKNFRIDSTGIDNEYCNAFAHLPKLETVYISANDYHHDTPTIYGALFYDCPKLREFTGENEIIKDSRTLAYRRTTSFQEHTHLIAFAPSGAERYVIPNSVDIIAARAFQFTTAMTSQVPLTVKEVVIPDNVKVFDIYYPNVSQTGTTNGSWFLNFNSLTSVTIPSSITFELGTYGVAGEYANFAFQGCTGLTNAVVNMNQTPTTHTDGFPWGFHMNGFFKDCISLSSVTFGSNFQYFDSNMFEGCVALTAITIPTSVTTFSTDVFTGCTALTSMTVTKDTVPIVQQATFRGIGENGVLTYPSAVTGYEQWLSTSNWYLGYYNWNKVDFVLENVSTYYLQYQGNVSGSGVSQSVFITANRSDYQVIASEVQNASGSGVTWLSVSGTPASGYTEFKIYPSTTAETQRNCWLQVVYSGDIYATISVVQTAASTGTTSETPTLTITQNIFFFASGATGASNSQALGVTSNVPYTISNTNNWYAVCGQTGTGSTVLQVYPTQENTGSSDRYGDFNLLYGDNQSVTIQVKQFSGSSSGDTGSTDAYIIYPVTPSSENPQMYLPADYNMPNYMKPLILDVFIPNTGKTFSVSADSQWLQLQYYSSGVSDNWTDLPRGGYVFFYAGYAQDNTTQNIRSTNMVLTYDGRNCGQQTMKQDSLVLAFSNNVDRTTPWTYSLTSNTNTVSFDVTGNVPFTLTLYDCTISTSGNTYTVTKGSGGSSNIVFKKTTGEQPHEVYDIDLQIWW